MRACGKRTRGVQVGADGEVAATGAVGGYAAKWQRWTANASPEKQDAQKLRDAGERAVATWQADPAGVAD